MVVGLFFTFVDACGSTFDYFAFVSESFWFGTIGRIRSSIRVHVSVNRLDI